MVAAQKVVPLEQIATAALCPNIHMDDKTDKDEPEEKVGRQDVPLVVIVQAPCWGCLPKKGGKRGHHEGGPAWGQVLLTSKNFQALTSNNGAEVEVMLLIGVCGQFVGFPCQPHVEDDQGHDCEDRMLLECKMEMLIGYQICQTYLPVDEEGGKCKGPECQMDKVVGCQHYLALEVWRLAVTDDVIDGDVPDQVEQAGQQANHQDPD